jgi:hypothetical protein
MRQKDMKETGNSVRAEIFIINSCFIRISTAVLLINNHKNLDFRPSYQAIKIGTNFGIFTISSAQMLPSLRTLQAPAYCTYLRYPCCGLPPAARTPVCHRPEIQGGPFGSDA